MTVSPRMIGSALGLAAPGEHADEREQQRPDDVELLLHGQRPEVLHRAGRGVRREVVDRAGRQAPVDDVEPAGHDVLGHVAPPDERQGDHRADDDADQREGGGRQQPPGAPGVEPLEGDVAALLQLAGQQVGHEVAGDDEEDVDPDEPTRQPRHAGVPQHDADDGDGPQPLDVRAEAGPVERLGRRGLGGGVRRLDGRLGHQQTQEGEAADTVRSLPAAARRPVRRAVGPSAVGVRALAADPAHRRSAPSRSRTSRRDTARQATTKATASPTCPAAPRSVRCSHQHAEGQQDAAQAEAHGRADPAVPLQPPGRHDRDQPHDRRAHEEAHRHRGHASVGRESHPPGEPDQRARRRWRPPPPGCGGGDR